MRESLIMKGHVVERVWGGSRFQSGSQPVGELWAISETSVVDGGPHAGATLEEVCRAAPRELLGSAVDGERFPLLIKLLDCADWLSVQVHPTDEQARRLEGENALGKTEGWHVLEAGEEARIVAGVRGDVPPEALRAAIESQQIGELLEYGTMRAGDSIFIPAGTIHALGPGILLYEVQQRSDITYRIYDWDRPAAAGRKLHLTESADVSRAGTVQWQDAPSAAGSEAQAELLRSPYFVLESLRPNGDSAIPRDTRGLSFHALTVVDGEVTLEHAGRLHPLTPFQSAVVPAAGRVYALRGRGHVLCSWVP